MQPSGLDEEATTTECFRGETRAFTCRLIIRSLRNKTVQNEILVDYRLRHFKNGNRESLVSAAWAPSHPGALLAGKRSAPDFQDGRGSAGGRGRGDLERLLTHKIQ